MQRLVYPVLLVCASALALTVCLRPSVGEELLALAENLSERASGPVPAAIPLPLSGGYGVTASPPSRPTAAARPASWPGGQTEAGPGWEEGPGVSDRRYQAPPSRPAGSFDDSRDSAPDWGGQHAADARFQPQPRSDNVPSQPGYGWAERPEVYPHAAAYPGPGREAQPARTARIPLRDAPPEAAPPPRQPAVPADAVPCEGAQIVSGVGPHAILVSDIWIVADQILARNRAKIPPDQVESQREILIRQSFRQLLQQQVDTKLVYYDALNALPKEAVENVEDQLTRIFERSELPKLMELWGVESQRELDQKLMRLGTSVQRHKRAFLEQATAQQWIRQQIKIDEDVNHEQMLTYYNQNLSDFEQPARARWEQLTVRISRYPSKEVARAALAQMGNQVMDGRPLAEVARERSDGSTAGQGGLRDWTTRGSLVCGELDRAIFGLPVGQLSPILEDETGYHVVRVIEREEASQTPFPDAQAEIRPKISQRRVQEQLQAYLAKLRKNTPVWTIFDEL